MTKEGDLNSKIIGILLRLKEEWYDREFSKEELLDDEKRPGYLIITKFNHQKKSHTKNLVGGTKHPLVGSIIKDDLPHLLRDTLLYTDGAIIIGKDKVLHRIGARILNNVHPSTIAKRLQKEEEEDESRMLGFAQEVNTRHVNAIYASWIMKGTTVFTMSAKTGEIRMYKKGKIRYSTIPEEIQEREKPKKKIILVSEIKDRRRKKNPIPFPL